MLILQFKHDNQTILYSKLTSAPLREEAILRLSYEFFGDPEPCMIHRSAVMNRIYMELQEYFQKNMDYLASSFLLKDLPERLVMFFDVGDWDRIIVEKRA